jgi:CheY-like chemotaxis protein
MATILVAEDSETIMLLMRTRLELAGHTVETAADGQEVIERLAAAGADELPDLLVLDAMMPRKSGIEALRELRQAGLEMPALIVSAYLWPGDSGLQLESEISGYLTKPIDFDFLLEEIEELTAPNPAGN